MFDHRDPYPHLRRFELKIFADGNSLAHALTYLQDPLCWWTYNATCDCRPANRGRLCLWRPANYLKLAPFKPPRPLSIHLYLPTRPLYLARFNPYSPPPPGARASRSSPTSRLRCSRFVSRLHSLHIPIFPPLLWKLRPRSNSMYFLPHVSSARRTSFSNFRLALSPHT